MRIKLFLVLVLSPLATAQDQTVPGSWNQAAAEMAKASLIVQSSYRFLMREANALHDPQLRKQTVDAIGNAHTCIQHRAGLTEDDKQRILQNLIDARLLDPQAGPQFPGGLEAGVFPPVLDDGTACPHLPQPFFAAPGGVFGGHHSYPGGLAIHEANNESLALAVTAQYHKLYGKTLHGAPVPFGSDITIDNDIVRAAPLWHDWAKTLVFQWNAYGKEFQELNFGGLGVTDDYGTQGDSRTGAHHILSLAEAMKRDLPAELVITQACAHSMPTQGNEFKVVNWLRAAAIIAQVDPVERGYLISGKAGLRLPPLGKLGTMPLFGEPPATDNFMTVYFLPEYAIHNLSDADNNFSVPVVSAIEAVLRNLAPEFGFDPLDTAVYNKGFRNRVLSWFTGERLYMIYAKKGVEGVRAELRHIFPAGKTC